MQKNQSKAVLEYIRTQYGIESDRPWIELPEYEVVRHSDTGKWFGLISPIKYEKLGVTDEDKKNQYCYILNAKCEPMLIDFLVTKPGFIRAYHMNKKHWITVFLDGTVDMEEITQVIDMSYDLTNKKTKTRKHKENQ